MAILIIAEKPSVAESIATALGANKRQDGYFEGNGYFVSFAFGHLYTLADTKDYNPDMEKWDLKDYPFIPQKFIYKPINDPGVKKQIKILKELVKKSDTIINACDGDREGSLIFAELKNDIGVTKPIKRLWITSHTPKDIEKGMNNLRDDMKDLEAAGYCRQQVDWIIGINLTVVYTLKTGGAYTLKVGRVILPTLKLIFDREVEIANFKSTPFYMLKCTFTAGEEAYIGTYYIKDGDSFNTRFSSKEKLINIQEAIKNQTGTIVKKESKKSKENAPRLFNLTDLQGHITSKFMGYSSDKVLDILQSLYEKKFVSYPRTSSRVLDDSQIDDVEESLNAVLDLPGLNLKNHAAVKFHTEKRVFDSSKVDSHPAIIPTYITPDLNKLSEAEKTVYMEVVKRFVAQFMPVAVYDTLEIITEVKGHEFITRGKVLIEEGWKELYINQVDTEEDQEEQEQEDKITAKNLKVGDRVISKDTEFKEGKTKPPAHYTESTLLKAMENCGKNVENEEEVLKGFTIGTPATRADTIKKLIETGYIYQKGKNLLITDLGAKVIHYFPAKRLLKVDFTGQIEKTLKDIENGQYDPKVFMEKMAAYIIKNVEEMKVSNIPTIQKEVNILGKCPECGRNVVETSKAFSCEGTRDNQCKFTLWKDDKFFKHFGKKMTLTIAKDLVNKKQAAVKGLKSPKKEGVKFDAIIHIKKNADTGYWNYEMDFDSKPKGKSKSKSKIRFKNNNKA